MISAACHAIFLQAVNHLLTAHKVPIPDPPNTFSYLLLPPLNPSMTTTSTPFASRSASPLPAFYSPSAISSSCPSDSDSDTTFLPSSRSGHGTKPTFLVGRIHRKAEMTSRLASFEAVYVYPQSRQRTSSLACILLCAISSFSPEPFKSCPTSTPIPSQAKSYPPFLHPTLTRCLPLVFLWLFFLSTLVLKDGSWSERRGQVTRALERVLVPAIAALVHRTTLSDLS